MPAALTLIDGLSDLPDPRVENTRRHLLLDILVIAPESLRDVPHLCLPLRSRRVGRYCGICTRQARRAARAPGTAQGHSLYRYLPARLVSCPV